MAWVIAGKPEGTLPEVGKVYTIKHRRKGEFVGKLTALNGEWGTFEVVSGKIHWASTENQINQRLYGDEAVTIRDTLSYLIEMEQSKESAEG